MLISSKVARCTPHEPMYAKKGPYNNGRQIPCLNPGFKGSAGYPPFLVWVVVPDFKHEHTFSVFCLVVSCCQ